MKKIFTLLGLLACLFTASLSYADPAASNRLWHIAIVIPRPINITEMAMQEFLKKKALNIRYTVVQYHAERESAESLVTRIRALQPDLIYTWGTPTTLAVAGPFDAGSDTLYIRDIPIVFNTVTDPIASRLAPSLKNQRRNLTGVIHIAPLLTQLNTIKAYRPFKHIGYIYNPLELNSVNVSTELQKLSINYPFHYTALPLPLSNQMPNAKAIPALIAQLVQAKVDILYLGPDTFVSLENRELITETALQAYLPAFSSVEEPVRTAKALFGLYTTNISSGRFAAFKIAQILEGHIPVSRIPLETLRDFTLLINMPVAQALKDYPPLPLLEIADTINAEPIKPDQ
jgi:putative ABC transport system substrate-binding protein